MAQLTEQDVLRIIQQERNQAGFGTSLVPFHTHNGVDSPKLFKAVYYGTSIHPPVGWTVVLGSAGSAGQDTVTHNLGTTRLCIVITPITATNTTATFGVANITNTTFNVYTAVSGGGLTAYDFGFIVAVLGTDNK